MITRLLPLVSLIALATPTFAGSPTGFADIPFGTPLGEAQKLIREREGLKAERAGENRLTYTGGNFAGQSVSRWTLVFAGGKLAVGSVLIEDVKKTAYDDLKDQLTKKYGKPDSEEGHHSFVCLWEWRSNGPRSVRLDFDYKGKVLVTYSHDGLVKSAPPAKEDL